MKEEFLVALDQGTTSSRTTVYDLSGAVRAACSEPLPVRFPASGWVEQDAEDVWQTQLRSLQTAVADIPPAQIKAIGITNQRETTIAWNKTTGEVLAPAIVWQCRRSAAICEELRQAGHQALIAERTGLVIDAYFSASKIIWMLRNVAGLAERIERGEPVVFGTVDSWLLYRLTGQAATEPSNASRTMIYDLAAKNWQAELLELTGIGEQNLPRLLPSAGAFGRTDILGVPIPITGMLGDQQASLLGHGCIEAESAKCTFGTGAFMLLNTGSERRRSNSGLLNSPAWVLAESPSPAAGEELFGSRTTFALEGSIFVAGSLVQWLRDKLGLIKSTDEIEARVQATSDSAGVVIVPAFVGLGAPYWDEEARGAIFGLTREASADHLLRAALEAVAHQTADLLDTPEFSALKRLQIDGGMSNNKCFAQILADLTGREIAVAQTAEATSLGAARIAALGAGICSSLAEAVARLKPSAGSGEDGSYFPQLGEDKRLVERAKWKRAVDRVRTGG